MPDAIFDTTTLSNFAAAGRTDLLESRFRGRAFVTAEVADELRRGVNAGYSYLNAVLNGIDVVNPAGWLCAPSASSPEEHRLRAEFDLLLDPGSDGCNEIIGRGNRAGDPSALHTSGVRLPCPCRFPVHQLAPRQP